MSEFELLNLHSPKSQSSGGKKSSESSSWEKSVGQDKEIPAHSFVSCESTSSPTSSSFSAKERKKSKKSTRETSFSHELKKTKIQSQNGISYVDSILPLPSDPEFSSSDSEDVSFDQSKRKKFLEAAKTSFRTNKVRDILTQRDDKNLKISDVEIDKSTHSVRIKQNKSRDFLHEKEVKKSVTSTSDLSYREKIRDRFNTVKEKAVESLSRPQSRSHSRFKLSTMKGGSRMEDLLKEEEDRVSAAMERHEKVKLRWQEISRFSLEKKGKIEDVGESFFAEGEHFISPSESATAEESKSLPSESSPTGQEDTKILTSEFLGIKEDWELVEYVKSDMDKKNKNDWGQKNLFYPSSHPVPPESKLEPGLTPRFKEEEGIYVGQKIPIPKQIKNKMECRIVKAVEGRKWFGKDGDLISTICPLKPFSTRPLLSDDEDSTSVQVVLKPAILRNTSHRYLDLSGNKNYVFDIDISSIDFTHHPLFSREDVVAQRLKDLYLKYRKKRETDNINRLNGRLSALRRTVTSLKLIINQSGDNANLREKLQKCENEIRELRELRYVEGQIDKQLINKIIATWNDLLKLREVQGYQNTLLKLNIKKKVTQSPKEEKLKWDAEIKQETKEIIRELEKKYENALQAYKEKYKSRIKSSKEMLKEKEKDEDENENSTDKASKSESANESESEKNAFNEEPDPPKPTAEAEIKAQVIENFKKSFRQPGEPELEFTLTQATNPDKPLYNNKEQLRRAAVKRCMIFVKLFYNGKEVCRSKTQSLSDNFTVSISQRFAIRILEWPESLMIEIHETGTLNRNLLVPGVYIPFPDPFTTVYNSEIEKHEFSSKISITYHHTAVGAGYNIIPCPDGSEFNNQAVCFYTSGTVSYRIGWVVDGGKILSPPEKYWMTRDFETTTTNLLEILRSGGTLCLPKLKEWADNSRLDPNDPYNSAFFHFIDNAENLEGVKPNHFRLNPLLEDFDFCKKSDIENNARLHLLRLRDMGESEFRDMKMIPLNEKQIDKEIFKDYERRLSMTHTLTDVLSSDPLDGHRVWGKKFLEEVQEKLLKQYRMGKQSRRFQDIITEESIPDVGTLGLTFMRWLRPKRPLHPVRKERKKITPQNLSDQEINIVVNVVRAFEVPVRKDLDTMSGSESIEGFSLVNVRPFVEISFRGITARTTTAEGANPTWNQDLKIPVRCKNGYFSPGNLQSIKNTLYLHLFDEIVIDLIEDESARETNIHQRLERHWLASMEIPFSTLYFNSKIEGTFKLYSPPVLLGYEREAHRRPLGLALGQEPSVSQRDATYITLFVTVQPALNPPKPIKVFQEKMESREAKNLKKHLESWQQERATMFPHRKVKTLVLDITGKSVCVTRFLKPLPLPSFTNEGKTTPETVARYVAMIPTSAESNVFPEYFDIWLTCDHVLRLLSGNTEDHAVFLCCYFLQLGLEAYVLLGSGIPRGLMAYVFVKEKEEKDGACFVWDPTNGQKYSVHDSFCPLQKIWANVQAEELPRRTRFDLTKKTDWCPAFGKNIAVPTGSIQPQLLEYKTTSRQSVDILRDKVEKKLRDNLMKWRKKNRTQWNRYCAATLRKLLPKLEEATWNLGDHTPDHIVELQPILASHKICGFPINMAYTNIEAISEAVKATGVHCNESLGVEFALAVYIHSYPNDVLSVWIYVASLVRRI